MYPIAQRCRNLNVGTLFPGLFLCLFATSHIVPGCVLWEQLSSSTLPQPQVDNCPISAPPPCTLRRTTHWHGWERLCLHTLALRYTLTPAALLPTGIAPLICCRMKIPQFRAFSPPLPYARYPFPLSTPRYFTVGAVVTSLTFSYRPDPSSQRPLNPI